MPENPVRSELQKLPRRLLAVIGVSPSPSTANDRSAPMESADFFPLNPRFAEIIRKKPPTCHSPPPKSFVTSFLKTTALSDLQNSSQCLHGALS
jgi:hypothetical protein